MSAINGTAHATHPADTEHFGDGVANRSHPKPQNAKQEQLESYTTRIPADGHHHTGVFSNAPLDNLDTGLKAGARGPSLVNDSMSRERISHFDHERIPERVVHARGAGAHGFFRLKESLEDVTCAELFTKVGGDTPMFVRFSTVLGQNGAAETAREVRGFASRFYTKQGNWDIVGNNIPVFFIQDGVKFVDLVHAAKPEPKIHLPQAQTAHDSFWDWMSLMPESAHMAMWILSDYTIPRSYRMISGFGVNTFVFYNAAGKRTFVKFHWRPQYGKHSLVWDEALKLGGQDPDFLRRDLSEAIDAGAYPKWDFGVQLVPEENEHDFDFDLLDCTKFIPEELVPIRYVGELTLNANPTNYFAETEQVAFCTSNQIVGITNSDDPMLSWRNFSYFDTQLSRLGGSNFNQIPINQSICPVIGTMRDGYHSHRINAGPNYYPNRFEVPDVPQKNGANYQSEETIKRNYKVNTGSLNNIPYPVEGLAGRFRGPKFAEHYDQASLFWNSMSPTEKEHIIETAQFEVGRCDDRVVQERMMNMFNEVDHDFALSVAAGFGIEVGEPKHKNHGKKTDGTNPISMLSKNNVFSAMGRKVAIFALDGFDSLQVSSMKSALESLGDIVMIIGGRKGPAFPKGVKAGDESASGVLPTNFTIESCRSTYFDALFFPDGDENYAKMLKMGRVKHFAMEAYGHCKPIAAAGAAAKWIHTTVLPGVEDANLDNMSGSFSNRNGLLLAPTLTSDDSNFISKIVKGVRDASNFGPAFVDACAQHRHWERDVSAVAF